MSCPPLVSVLMPTCNHGGYLRDSIQSVLDQAEVSLELIVIDDGSTDNTPAVAASFGNAIRYYRQPNAGGAAALNHGLREARGEFIAVLDSDDLWLPGKLARQVRHLRENPECSFCFGRLRYFLEPGHPMPPRYKAADLDGTQEGAYPSLMLVRAVVFAQVGLFNADLKIAYDTDWFGRAKSHGYRFHHMDDLVALKRIHDSNISSDLAATNRELLQLLRVASRRNTKNSVASS